MAVSGFNAYAAGSKIYGAGRSMPNVGPVDPAGYRVRDKKYKAYMQRNAALKRMNKDLTNQQMTSGWLGYFYGREKGVR